LDTKRCVKYLSEVGPSITVPLLPTFFLESAYRMAISSAPTLESLSQSLLPLHRAAIRSDDSPFYRGT
jgi:hypothetical protein